MTKVKNEGLFPVLWIRIHRVQIRIQHFRLNTDLDPDQDSIRIEGFEIYSLKKLYFLYRKLHFTYP
jgi:hypothetical protein